MRLQLTLLLVALVLALGPRTARAEMAVGDVPTVSVSLIDGTEFELADHLGEVVLIDFWATWCGPCRESFPAYAELHEQYADRGLVVLAVSVDEELGDVRHFLDRIPAPFSIAWDREHTSAEAFAPPTMPTAYLIDRSGTIRHVLPGFRRAELDALEALVRELLDESA